MITLKPVTKLTLIPLIFLVALLSLLVNNWWGLTSNYDQWRILNLIFIAYIIVSSLWKNLKTHTPVAISRNTSILLISISLLGSLISFLSDCSIASYWGLTGIILTVFSVAFLSQLLSGDIAAFFEVLVLLCFGVLFVLSLQFIFGYIVSVSVGFFDRSVFFEEIYNIRFLNQFQTLVLPLVIGGIFHKRISPRKRLFLHFILVTQLVVLFLLSSRGTFLALVVCSIIAFILHVWSLRQVGKLVLWVFISFLIYVFFFYIIPENFFEQSKDITVRTSSSGRIDLWLYSLKVWEDNWLTGIGGQSFQSQGVISQPAAHPHNFVFLTLFEWGLGGGLILVAVLAYYTRIIFYFKKNALLFNTHTGLVVLVICSGIVHGLVSGIFTMPIPQTLMLIFTSLLLAYYFQHNEVEQKKVFSIQTLLFKLGFSIILFILVSFFLIYAFIWYEHQNAINEQNKFTSLRPSPRVWLNGNVPAPFCSSVRLSK